MTAIGTAHRRIRRARGPGGASSSSLVPELDRTTRPLALRHSIGRPLPW